MGATHTVNSSGTDPVDGDPGADRRLRRRRRDRRGRSSRDLEAGVLRPRPGRHGRAGRRADPGHDGPRHPADRRLRPRRGPQVELVRRLPAVPRLPDARRPLPAGPARPGRVRHRGDRHRRRRGGVRQDARAATCCARWWSSGERLRVDHAVVSGTFCLDGETHEVDNNIWVVGDDEECVVIDAPHDVDDILDGRRRAAGQGDRAAPTPTTTTSASRRRCASAVAAPILLHPDDRPLWELTHPDELWDVDLEDGQSIKVGRRRAQGAAHARATRRARSASTSTTSAASSPATPCSTAGRGRPVGPSATPTVIKDSIRRAALRACPTTPSCTPATATTPRSAPSARPRLTRAMPDCDRMRSVPAGAAAMLRRVVTLVLALGLTASACSGDPAAEEPAAPPASRPPRRRARPRRPSASASSRGGGRRGRAERAARLVGRMPLPDLAGR